MRLRANYPYTIRRTLHRHSCKISANPWCCHGSPVTALALLCLVLHPESQQPISENKGTPGIRNSEKNNTRWIQWKPLPIYFLTYWKLAGTNRVPCLGRYELTDDAVLLAEALVFIRLHCPHVLQVDCGQNTAKTWEKLQETDRWIYAMVTQHSHRFNC